MPNITKRIISDEVIFKLAGGLRPTKFPIDERDIWKATEQKINAMFGMRQFTINLPNGETIPDNLVLAVYEDIAVTSISNYSYATLPVMPISLPRAAGINEIRPILSKRGTDRVYGNPAIPLQAGQNYLLQADTLLNNLMGQIGYEPNGITINFTSDITTYGISTCQMKLVVFDMSQYGVSDILPVPSDYEQQIVDELVKEFAPVLAKSGEVNNWSTINQQQPAKQ